MKTNNSTATVELSQLEQRSYWQASTLAIIEVVLATLLGRVLWQGFERFTTLGQMEVSAGLNFSPGIARILIAVCLFLWHRKSFAEYGVSLRGWSDHLKTGLIWIVILILICLPVRFGFIHNHGSLQSPYGSWQSPYLIDTAIAFAFLALFPWMFRFSQSISTIMPTPVAIIVLLGLWTTPLGLACYSIVLLFIFFLV